MQYLGDALHGKKEVFSYGIFLNLLWCIMLKTMQLDDKTRKIKKIFKILTLTDL